MKLTRFIFVASLACTLVLQNGCLTPVGAEKTFPALTYRQAHDNAVRNSEPSVETRVVLHRYSERERFSKDPDETLKSLHQRALDTNDRELFFALADLSYLAGERLRHNVKSWERRDPRDYYLAASIYAWFFLFGDAHEPLPDPFDTRFRTACDLYNYGLAWALTERHGTNGVAVLAGATRRLPVGQLQIELDVSRFPWDLAGFDRFVLADQFQVRGLSIRNGQSGLGAPLAAVTKPVGDTGLSRALPATVLLQLKGALRELNQGSCRATLELHSTYDEATVKVGDRTIPLETDSTFPLAYVLNQASLWSLGTVQFLSNKERVPSDIYRMQPYRPGRVPVVFVHGTFSSPVWWAEMLNTLGADPELRQGCQFWYFVYNSGNPLVYSAEKLRETLTAKVKEMDPSGTDAALQQMVIIGHSQGGLLTKLTATEPGDRLLLSLLKTNRLGELDLTPEQESLLRRHTSFPALPFVKRVVFISTPHRGSYLAGSFARNLARKLVTLPRELADRTKQLARLTSKLKLPAELKNVPTSIDSMSPRNPFLLALAETPIAPGIKAHSIISVKGMGDFHKGKDGLVTYSSAHLENVESEFIARSSHSCQSKPPVIEEVRRILREHLASLPATSHH